MDQRNPKSLNSGDMPTVCFIVPESQGEITGGNLYNHQIMNALPEFGLKVCQIQIPRRFAMESICENFIEQMPHADIVLEDELAYRNLTPFNHALRVKKERPIILGLIHVFGFQIGEGDWEKEAAYLHTLDGAIYVSEAVARIGRRLAPRLPSVVVNPSCSHLSNTLSGSPKKSLKKPLTLISVGNLLPNKGYLEVLPLLANFKAKLAEASGGKESFVYVIVSSDGHKSYRDQLMLAIKGFGLQENIIFQTSDSLRNAAEHCLILRNADIYVTTSRYESFSIATLEASANGLPILCLSAGGVRDWVSEGKCGLHLDHGEESDFSEAVLRLRQDLDLYHRLSRNSIVCALAFECWQEAAGKLAKFMARCTRPDKTPSFCENVPFVSRSGSLGKATKSL
jgi:glycosyltransferase involved in cell wall biosynthesis